jgi:hypothetical protein
VTSGGIRGRWGSERCRTIDDRGGSAGAGSEPIEVVAGFEIVVRNGETFDVPVPVQPGDGRFTVVSWRSYEPNEEDDFRCSFVDAGDHIVARGDLGDSGALCRATITVVQVNSPSIAVQRKEIEVWNPPADNVHQELLVVPFGFEAMTLVA